MKLSKLRGHFDAPLPPGQGTMTFIHNGQDIEFLVSLVERTEYKEAVESNPISSLEIFFSNGYKLTSYGEAEIRSSKDMFYRALRGEITHKSEYDENGYRKNGTPLILEAIKARNKLMQEKNQTRQTLKLK